MADVARAAGVSQQTVSRVANGLPNVNEQTRQRVQAAMQELGFRPSYAGRSLRDGRYHSVGLCVNDVTKFGNLSMIDGIASAAREHNCAITLVEMSKTEEFSLAEATRRMAALPVDGIIIGMSRMAPDFETFDPLPGIGTVIVTMYAHPRVTTVDSDHYGCSLLLMDTCLSWGTIRFAILAARRSRSTNNFVAPVGRMHSSVNTSSRQSRSRATGLPTAATRPAGTWPSTTAP